MGSSELPDFEAADAAAGAVPRRRLLVRDLNTHLMCTLCDGYLIDATVINECMHTFCRSCIVRYLESSRYCPSCEILIHKNKPLSALRPDKNLQLLIYKLIPAVYQNEVKRRSEFYSNARASSSCSEDSILTDSHTDSPEQSVLCHINEHDVDFFSPDDSISLSLEYYTDGHLDIDMDNNNSLGTVKRASDIQEALDDALDTASLRSRMDRALKETTPKDVYCNLITSDNNENIIHKRYLQCPAGVNIKHLTKFIRMKYGLSFQHRVDIIYEGEILPKHFTLMDVAYTFKWKRNNPMRFMYRIFESTKATMLKIYQQPTKPPLQTKPDVPPTPEAPLPPPTTPATPPISPPSEPVDPTKNTTATTTDKRLTQKIPTMDLKPITPQLFAIIPPDPQPVAIDEDNLLEKEREIQEFAKKRDLEWANLIRQSLSPEIALEPPPHVSPTVSQKLYPTLNNLLSSKPLATSKSANSFETKEKSTPKKRKKSKHSKHFASLPKRRKLHAEIQNQTNEKDDILKLKVKLTPSVHKTHKHKHSNNTEHLPVASSTTPPTTVTATPSTSQSDGGTTTGAIPELSAKERLLQMRQVRHKTIHPPSIPQEKAEKPKPAPVTSSDVTLTRPSTSLSPQEPIKPPKSSPPPAKKVRFDIDAKPKPENKDPPKTNKCVPHLVAPNSFTVSKVMSGEKRKPEQDLNNQPDPKVPSLEIMLISPPGQTGQSGNTSATKQTNLVGNKNFPINTKNTPSIIKPPANSRLSLSQSKIIMMKNLNLTQAIPKNTNPVPANKTLPSTPKTPPNPLNPPNPVRSIPPPNNTPPMPSSMTNKGNGTLAAGSGIKSSPKPSAKPSVPQSSPTIIKKLTTANATNGKPTANRPPPGTIPLSKIKKAVTKFPPNLLAPKKPQKIDNFGALDLSEKSTRVSPKLPEAKDGKEEQVENKNAVKIEVQKIVQNNQNLSNLHILSESAVHIRDLMVSAQNKNMSTPAKPKAKMDPTKLALALKNAQNNKSNGGEVKKVPEHPPNSKLNPVNTTKSAPTMASPSITISSGIRVQNSRPVDVAAPKSTISHLAGMLENGKKPTPSPSEKLTQKLAENKLINSLLHSNNIKSFTSQQQQPTAALKNPTSASSSPLSPTSSLTNVKPPINNPSPKTSSSSPMPTRTPPPPPPTPAVPVQSTISGTPPTSIGCSGTQPPKQATTTTTPLQSPLQTLRIPVLQNSKSLQAQMRSLQKMPKLNEISKLSQFSAQIRATPNLAVRNIPNPSALLARHAVQNKQQNTSSNSSSLLLDSNTGDGKHGGVAAADGTKT